MHIKQVIIRGFKTYKDQTQLSQDFDKGVNVVVGYNGSGKSNFFNAILFVISDRYGTLRNETRKSLLHEGAGPAVISAFVEIVFDNSDKRMPLDKDEVRIRRTIAAKKDDYTLDGKAATKNEVFKLLESCGFAKSNPYYIVLQGQVSELTLQTDANRLELFKEVSGASTYDERRQECTRILEDLNVKREKTDGIIEGVRRKIYALEEEQKELRQYQKFEQQRRCLEFVMTDRDWKSTQERIDKLEVQKADASARLHQVQRDLAVAQERTVEADNEVFQVAAAKAQIEAKRQDCDRSRGLRVQELTTVRLELDDERSRAKAIKLRLEENLKEKQSIEEQIRDAEGKLGEQQPELEKKLASLRDMAQRKHVAQVERDSLLAKQGRGSHYSSVAQRNKFLDDEIKRRQQKVDSQQKALKESTAKIKELSNNQERCKKRIAEKRQAIKTHEAALGPELASRLDEINAALEQSSEQRRLLLQRREAMVHEKEQTKAKAQQLQNRLEGTMPRSLRSALTDALAKVGSLGWNDKVLGMLCDSIRVDPKYAVAVESVAGNALFNLLVTNDDTAAEIIKYVRQYQLGSIVCTPLNQIRPRKIDYPKIKGCTPLAQLIDCPEQVRPAVLQVFGRTMVCTSIDLCDTVSHVHGLDAVTVDGDRVTSQGTMTGGYQDPSRYIRLKLCSERRDMEAKADAVAQQLPDIERKVQESSQQLDALHMRKRDTYALRQTRRSELSQATEALHEGERELQRHTEAYGRQKEHEHEVATSLAEYTAGMEALIRERQSKTLGKLTDEEHAQVENLTAELKVIAGDFNVLEESCHKLQRDIRGKEQHLNGFLRRRHHEIEDELMRSSQQDHHERAEERDRAAQRLQLQVTDIEHEMERLSAELKAQDEQVGERKQRLEDVQKEANVLQANVSAQCALIDDVALKINNLTKKKGEYDEKLRKLTIVAADLATYKAMPSNQVVEELRNVTKEISKFDHVNKKAIDQFATFQDQLRDLDEEGAEITRSRQAIENFITEVDAKKEHLLTDVLQKVDKHFQDIFSELVRDGRARLKTCIADEDIDSSLHPAKRKRTTELASGISGVKIEVSFSGQAQSFLSMSQLSGGQKTVVALAMIFAIQRLEPAPFYLFDEVDAALDTQYRTAVARLIQKDSQQGAQMIITTFRPEIIDIADSCYRVSMRNRVSAIDSVERAKAKEVVDQQVVQEGLAP